MLYNICFQPLKFPPLEKKKLFCLNKTISHEAKDFIQCLLDKNPNKRMVNPKEMKKHPFFDSIDFKRILLLLYIDILDIDPQYVPTPTYPTEFSETFRPLQVAGDDGNASDDEQFIKIDDPHWEDG